MTNPFEKIGIIFQGGIHEEEEPEAGRMGRLSYIRQRFI